MIKHIKYFLILLVLGATACDENLEELNENPNQPEEVNTNVLIPSALRRSVNSMVTESFLIGNNAAQLTAKSLRVEVDIYSWNPFTTVWDELYSTLSDVIEIEDVALERQNANVEGVALILKSWIFSTLTDAYGDIPYTEAVQGIKNGDFFPAYDRQEDIYLGENGLLAELERANEIMGPGNGPINGDPLFNGDPMLWRRFANSLRLRLLTHISNKTDVSSQMQDILDNDPVITDNSENAILTYPGSFPNEFPLVPLKQGDFDAVLISNRTVGVMKDFNDPRLARYARPDSGSVINARLVNQDDPAFYRGADNGSDRCDKSGSRLGFAYYDYPGHDRVGEKAEGIIVSHAEVEFTLAEAAQKGQISADPATHYREGIRSSMEYYEVNFEDFGWEDFEDFYNNSGVAYDEAQGLDQIRQQKWLALFFHGLEPYFEVRRWLAEEDFNWNAFDYLEPTCQNVNDDMLPVRFLYPGREKSLNNENVQEAIDRLGGDTQNAKPWMVDF